MDPSTTPIHEDGGALQSREHRDLLDIIDKMRSQGMNRYVDLPQITVCGDQSAGKSSVLEAISHMSFPAKDNLCTRFATELILRRSASVGVKVHIIPSPDRSKEDKKRLSAFGYTQSNLDIGQVVEKAKDAMGLNGNDKVFSTDVLRVEVSGPSQPHLTLVDLPGLFLAGNKDQSEEDSKLVESLVLSYMRKPRSIILAVVSAKSDFNLQQVTRLTRSLDPQGIRTLGLITKPDTLDEGSDSERFYVELAQNKDVQFRLGWHVLRNRNYSERDVSTTERDRNEADFFSKGVWAFLKPSQLGVKELKLRLSNVLRDQILMQLPSVLEDIETGIKQCQQKLAKLGDSRATVSEQRKYLHKTGTGYTNLLQAAIDGVYTDAFFADAKMRLRAVVQNTLSDFAQQMREEGHSRIILEDPVPRGKNSRLISRSAYIEEVRVLMRESRGRELPGTYNPMIVAELFSQQCKPWETLVHNLSERILSTTYATVASALQYVVDEHTAGSLIREIIDPSMESLKVDLTTKVDEILTPHLRGHPITYNHYLTENVQKAQAARRRREMEKQVKCFLDVDELTRGTANHWFDMTALLDTLTSYTESDMEKFSCSMAVDMMQAYYKVALKKLVDEISVLAIERRLMQRLPSLLSSEVICNFTDTELQRIAGESSESAAERVRATEKLEVLESGMTELKRLKKYNPLMSNSQQHVSTEISTTGHNQIEEEDIEQHDAPTDAEIIMEAAPLPSTPEEWSPETPAISLEEPRWPAVWGERVDKKGGPRKGGKK